VSVWVAGEALIDLFGTASDEKAIVGGGAANTAKSLSRLGVSTSFIGCISKDKFGESIINELENVDLSLIHRSALPTALARVSLGLDGAPKYEFQIDNTATFNFTKDWLPISKPDALHIGSLATVIEPGAGELFEWAKSLGTKVIYDPNVRPSVIADKDKYRRAVKKWIEIATIVKISDEDMKWLECGQVDDYLELGPSLVVLTHGASGITGYKADGEVSVPGLRIELVDTVGAGDTVGAVLVEGLIRHGLETLVTEKLLEVLTRAARAAAITCSRAGANPPSAKELEL